MMDSQQPTVSTSQPQIPWASQPPLAMLSRRALDEEKHPFAKDLTHNVVGRADACLVEAVRREGQEAGHEGVDATQDLQGHKDEKQRSVIRTSPARHAKRRAGRQAS